MPRRQRSMAGIRRDVNIPKPLQVVFDHIIADSDPHHFKFWLGEIDHGRTSSVEAELDDPVIDHNVCDFEDFWVDVRRNVLGS